MAASDRFVIFDPVQFIRRGWINRNRILKAGFNQAQFINVPIAKHDRETAIRDVGIRDVGISDAADWRSKIVRQLSHYKKRAPHFVEVMALVERALDIETQSIVTLNTHYLRAVSDALGFSVDFVAYSEIESFVKPADEWALHVSVALGADSYFNPIGGRDFFDAGKFRGGSVGDTASVYPRQRISISVSKSQSEVLRIS